jgi:outer membrane autotransporter protein
VTCDTTNTIKGVANPMLLFPGGPLPLAGVILPGATVGGLGLRFESTPEGDPLSVTNAGTVTIAQASNALELIGHGGNVLYTGNGSVINTGSGGALSITNTGIGNVDATIGGNILATGGTAIATNTAAGNSTINIIGGMISATGGTAIATKTEAGNSTININSIVQGIGSVANPVISATSGTGTTTINNNASGVIRSINGDAKDLAISSPVTTGQIVINNAGTLLGRISLTDGNDVFNNTGTWTASDGAGPAANFGGGLNTLNNSGTISTASTFVGIETINNGVGGVINAGNIPGAGGAMFTTSKVQTVNNAGTLNVNGTASFIGAPGSTFNNLGTGVINMQNGNTTDRVTTSGNYVGAPGSRLNVDINLAQNNASQRADLLSIGGNSSGTTAINLNVVSNARGFFTTPIPLVQVAPGGATFTVANPGALAPSGLVSYAVEEIAPGDFSVVSHFNAGVGGTLMAGLAASVISIQNFFEPFNGGLSTRNPGSPLLGTFDTRDPNRPVGGMWIRANGGHNQVDTVATAFLPNGQSPASGISTNTNYAGYQVGFDSGLLNLFDSSWNIHAGVTGGQVFASDAETTGLGKLDLGQNFLGAYAVATRGAFFADVFVRRDWYDAKPVLPMIEQNTDFSGRGYGVVATMGYNFRLNNGYFIEPQVGLHLTRANFDTVNLPADQQMAINSVDSTLFRASVRVGKTFNVADRLVAQPFISASVLHEFENQLGAQFFEPVGNVLIPITTSQVGTFGQYGVGIAASVPGTGTLGFVRFDGRVGENIRGWSLTGGARVSFNSP